MSRRTIHLHVERLVIEGFAPGSAVGGARVADGVERELRRLLAGASPPAWRDGARERLRAPPFRLPPAASPERLGEGIAAAICASLAPEERP